ncbi:MAG TPA: ABC transporter permease [Chryseolinea sp.]|nr:ABC transporter permease [Chryseolinea sp.]
MKKHKVIPPPLAQKILLSFLRDDLADDVMGDLEEKFYVTLHSKSLFAAKLNYWRQVLSYLRPFAVRKSQPLDLTSYAMYKSYFKIGWRNLLKNKTYSLINIGGLAIGLACCIAIGLYTWDEYSYDRFHTRYNDIYRVVDQQVMGGDVFDIAATPGPLGIALKSDFPEIQKSCHVGKIRSSGILQRGESAIEPGQALQVDNAFFSVFDFKLIQGNEQKALIGPNDVVITESIAARLFGPDWQRSSNVLGQQIQFNKDRLLSVVGVAFDPPTNSHIQFDVLLSSRYDELNSRNYNWESNNYNTYILLDPSADAQALERKLHKHLGKYVSNTSDITLFLQPLSKIYLFSDFDFQTDWSKTSDIVYVRIFLAVGLIVLLIALSNFINLSTARATKRAKEIGVRKVIGALHKQLVTQFLSESLIMAFLSVCLALFLLQLLLPLLNEISMKSLHIPFAEPYFLLIVAGFTLLISLMAGIYPAFYLSNFQPVKVLKGFFSSGSGQLFRQCLVVGQFTLSVILIIGTIVIYQQLTFVQNKNLGFDKSQLLYIALKNDLPAKALLMKNDLQTHTSIASASIASNNLIDVIRSTGAVEWEGKLPEDKILLTHMNVDYDFLSTTGMTLISGRNINPDISSDTVSAYLINETAATRMGWRPSEALGKKLAMWGYNGEVIGVVKDFHFRPMTAAIEPFLFRYWPRESCSGLFVKAKANQIQDAMAVIEKIYKKYDPQSTLSYQFVDEGLQNQYRIEQNTGRIVLCFSVLAILVSCLGLFGLATYTAEQRIKEIGVRKVLGASVGSIVKLLSHDFVRLVFIAILIASPVAWWSMDHWLKDFAYKINLQWWMFILAGMMAVIIALLTVSYQSFKAAMVNPIRNLRTE